MIQIGSAVWFQELRSIFALKIPTAMQKATSKNNPLYAVVWRSRSWHPTVSAGIPKKQFNAARVVNVLRQGATPLKELESGILI